MSADALMDSEIECPRCARRWAWLGDQGQSIRLYSACLVCLLFDHSGKTEEEQDALVQSVMDERERVEAETGRRVLPCPYCGLLAGEARPDCERCHGRGWVLGYPPGYNRLSPHS